MVEWPFIYLWKWSWRISTCTSPHPPLLQPRSVPRIRTVDLESPKTLSISFDKPTSLAASTPFVGSRDWHQVCWRQVWARCCSGFWLRRSWPRQRRRPFDGSISLRWPWRFGSWWLAASCDLLESPRRGCFGKSRFLSRWHPCWRPRR